MPPLRTALMQSRPLLDPSPHTIVLSLILSNPLYHKCRISDHLYLVLQWGLHTGRWSRLEIAKMVNVYTIDGRMRQIRKHEGNPARAPDGTIMEIDGVACPGNTGEPLGPWDLDNVKECAGYLEWRRGLELGLEEVLKSGVSKENVNSPRPGKEELERASRSEGVWLNGKPVSNEVRKKLASMRDGIRDKLQGVLTFAQKSITLEEPKKVLHDMLREGFEAVMGGEKAREYCGVFGGMIMKILERVEAFLEYLNDRVELEDVRQQRLDEIWEIFEVALEEKGKRKMEDGAEHPPKKARAVACQDANDDGEHNVSSKRSGLTHPSRPSSEPPMGPSKLSQKGALKDFRERERRCSSACLETPRSSRSTHKPASYPNKPNLPSETEDNETTEEEENYEGVKEILVRVPRSCVPTVFRSIEVEKNTERSRSAEETSEKPFTPGLIQMVKEHEFTSDSTQSEKPFSSIPFTDFACSSFSESTNRQTSNETLVLTPEARSHKQIEVRSKRPPHSSPTPADIKEQENLDNDDEILFLREVKAEPDSSENGRFPFFQADIKTEELIDLEDDGESLFLPRGKAKPQHRLSRTIINLDGSEVIKIEDEDSGDDIQELSPKEWRKNVKKRRQVSFRY